MNIQNLIPFIFVSFFYSLSHQIFITSITFLYSLWNVKEIFCWSNHFSWIIAHVCCTDIIYILIFVLVHLRGLISLKAYWIYGNLFRSKLLELHSFYMRISELFGGRGILIFLNIQTYKTTDIISIILFLWHKFNTSETTLRCVSEELTLIHNFIKPL